MLENKALKSLDGAIRSVYRSIRVPLDRDYRQNLEKWQELQLAQDAVAASNPRILLVTLPKSGSQFISETLLRQTGLSRAYICRGYFPHDLVNLDDIYLLRETPFLAQTHIDPCLFNFRVLESYFQRWMLHIRDPRAMLLSWVHHMNSQVRAGGLSEFVAHRAYNWPETSNFFSWELDDQISWAIENVLSLAVRWIQDWLDVYDQSCGNILLTSYEEMVDKGDKFFNGIYDFYGLGDHSAVLSAHFRFRSKDRIPHYRSGKKEEWKNVFAMPQRQRCYELIPSDLRSRFCWGI